MIQSFYLKSFMAHKEFHVEECAPINIIVGNNDTGKTGLLKLLYATTKTLDIYSRVQHDDGEGNLKKMLAEKLIGVYQPGKKGLGELVNKMTTEKLYVDVEFRHKTLNYHDRLFFSFGDSTTNTIVTAPERIGAISENFRCLFIPAKEVLTALKAIRATRENLHIRGFDDTYLDLIKALSLPTVSGNVKLELAKLNPRLANVLDGNIEQNADNDFIFKRGNTEFSMSLTAEGIKKIGIFTTLIRNRQLNASSVLFLDEPETTLHPQAIRELVEMLVLMAKSGIQIFLATHSYVVLKQFSICVRRENISANFYALRREKGSPIQYEQYDLALGFPANSLSDEAMKMADEEIALDLGV